MARVEQSHLLQRSKHPSRPWKLNSIVPAAVQLKTDANTKLAVQQLLDRCSRGWWAGREIGGFDSQVIMAVGHGLSIKCAHLKVGSVSLGLESPSANSCSAMKRTELHGAHNYG